MVCIGTDTLGRRTEPTDGSDARPVSVPGVVAAAIWALGLLVGLIALALGHQVVAAIALVLAISAPWFGLGWVAHVQRRESHARRANSAQVASYAGGWPAL